MTDFPSPVFRWRYIPSLFTALPLAPVEFLHVNVLLLLYPVACYSYFASLSVLPFGSRSLLHAFFVSNLCFACFASQTPVLCNAIPSAPIKFVARLCLILLYSVIFVLRALPHKHWVCEVLFHRLP